MSDQRNGEPWREWLEREVRALEEKIEHLEEKFDLQIQNRDDNLESQAREYERRLKELNHEAERLKEAALLSVSREKYDADREADRAQMDVIKAQVIEEAAKHAGREVEKSKGMTIGLAVLAIAISVLSLLTRVVW